MVSVSVTQIFINMVPDKNKLCNKHVSQAKLQFYKSLFGILDFPFKLYC